MKKTRFQSKYSKHDVFYARGDWLRPQFGLWDCLDPVAAAMLDLVEAQNELAELFDDVASWMDPDEKLFKAAVKKRHAAGEKVMQMLDSRYRWPNPELGR